MRVIAGSARRLKLVAPQGNDTRPTQDIIKETLFNIIQNEVPGSIFVDLFAGSGSIGIEALSRGAAKAYFAENGSACAKCLLQNLETTRLGDRAVFLKGDAVQALSRIREDVVDLVYMDPPYEAGFYEPVLQVLSRQPYVKEHTLVIAESNVRADFSFAARYGFVIEKEKRYKNNQHVFFRPKRKEPDAT